jgi:hypothetical protein
VRFWRSFKREELTWQSARFYWWHGQREQIFQMPAESHECREQELVRWHPGPCAHCRGGSSLYDFLRGRGEAAGEIQGHSDNEIIEELIARERAWLAEWIALCPHQAVEEHLLTAYDEGSEHIVYLSADSSSVIKLTRRGLYGDLYYLVGERVYQRCCTPGEYLLRLALLEEHFGFGAELLGATEAGQIVTRQPFVKGDPPTEAEVTEFLTSAGVEPVKPSCWLWKKRGVNQALEYWIGDARADNFVKTPNGLVPIDVRMWLVLREES